MNYRKLGNSDLEVSEIAFGCMSLGKDQRTNHDLIHKAFDKGINFFDTADLYDRGWNEESVGKALSDIRDEVIIATKVGNQWRPDGSGWDWNPTKEHILSAVDRSLKRLNIDTIDLYQLHGGTIDDPIDDTIDAFEMLKQQGKIRYYGISSIRPNVIREYISRSGISSVMMQYSFLDRRPEESCLGALEEAGISVLTRGSLAQGLLIDKPAREYLGYPADKVEGIQRAVHQTGSPAGVSLQFVLDHPAVASAVVGVRTSDQLTGVLDGYHNPENANEIEKLKNILDINVYEKHR